MAKRRRGARDGDGLLGAMGQEEQRPHHPEQEQEQERRLYLILDDDPLGYSIRAISLSSRPSSSSTRKKKKKKTTSGHVCRRLPRPIISLEAERGLPSSFAAIGTRIAMTQSLNPRGAGDYLMAMYDVRRRALSFGPGRLALHMPIYLPMGTDDTELFALDSCSFWKLSLDPRWPPPPGHLRGLDDVPWSWRMLPLQPFDRLDVTSHAALPDGRTILLSTDEYWPDEDPYYSTPDQSQSTFSFDTGASLWGKCGDWALPFAGRAYFVRRLRAFVGLSKHLSGHLASCRLEGDHHRPAALRLGKEKLFSDDLAETHVSAKLVTRRAAAAAAVSSALWSASPSSVLLLLLMKSSPGPVIVIV